MSTPILPPYLPLILFLASSLAVIYTYYCKGILGDLVRALSERGATSEESAVELSDIFQGKVKRAVLSLALSKGTTLKRHVLKSSDGKLYLSENADTARFNGKGISLKSTLLCILVLAVFCVLLHFVTPILQSFMGDDNYTYVPDDYISENTSSDNSNQDTSENTSEEEANSEDTSSSVSDRFQLA